MLRQFIPIFTNNMKKYYLMSFARLESTDPEPKFRHESNTSKRSSNGKSTDKCSPEYLQGLEICKNALREIQNYSQIDFDCDDPLPLDWSDLSDDDPITSDTSSMVKLFDKNPDANEKKLMYDKYDRSFTSSQQFGNGHTKHVYCAGDLAMFFTYTLGKKVRPVIVLSSSMHNKLHGARILIAPLSSNPSNTALHQFSVNPADTLYGQVLKQKSNILFDYSTMVSSSYLKPTNDGVNKATLGATLVWWRWRIDSILSTD